MAKANTTFEMVATYTVTSNEGTVTFSSIPQNFTDLKLVMTGGYTWLDASSYSRINGDTGTNYIANYISGGTSSTFSVGALGADNAFNFGWYPYPNTSTNRGIMIIDYFNYSNTNVFKSTQATALEPAGNNGLTFNCGTWRSKTAISSLTFYFGSYGTPLWVASTNFTLYGIKAA